MGLFFIERLMIIFPTNFIFEKKENHIKFFIIIRDYYDEYFEKNNYTITIEFNCAAYCTINIIKSNRKVEFTCKYYSTLKEFENKMKQAKDILEF